MGNSLASSVSRLALAAEKQEMATIMAALDPELRPLRDEAERVLKQVRPTEVVITKCDVVVDPAKKPPEAVANLIVRVTGNVIDKGTPGTVLAGVKVLLYKKDGQWFVKDAEVEPVRPGKNRYSRQVGGESATFSPPPTPPSCCHKAPRQAHQQAPYPPTRSRPYLAPHGSPG